MRASLFEIWKLTQRTLEAAGVPDGHDREGAFAVQWLSGRGFPGFEMFGEAKPEIASIWSLAMASETELQAAGSPLISSGADVIDFCAAAAEGAERGVASIVVRAARGPVFLLPFAGRRCLNKGACRLHWSADGGGEFDAVAAGAEAIWLNASGVEEQGLYQMNTPVDITVTCDCDGAALRAGDGAPAGALLNPAIL
ncbi:MAG: hypothetical protein H8E30_07145 [Alphaproteobacteria bacterium]|nr:hypothetical protein [Alphaproteobacteria bacterium]